MSHIEQEMRDRKYPVAEDIALQRKVWRFERAGWYVLLLVVILTLAGLFSKGPLSDVHATSAGQDLTIEYERFHRNGSAYGMVIHAQGQPSKPLTILISHPMLEGFSIESIQPQPDRSMGTTEGLAISTQTDGQGRATLYVTWRSEGIGLFKSAISIPGGGNIPITQFIYP